MNALPPAARRAGYATAEEHAKRQAARLSRLAGKRSAIVLGPVVWDLDPGARGSYFVVGIPERHRWRFEQTRGEDHDALERFRTALWLALIERRPIVIYDMDDELRMARLCHAILPTWQTSALCREIATERAQTAAFHHPAPEVVQ